MGVKPVEKLSEKRVLLFGLGGVGGAALEAMVRAGIGAFDLVDDDCFTFSNLNRQILSKRELVGTPKVDAAEQRIREINPGCRVRKYKMFYLPETRGALNFKDYDYIVDCIDTVKAKIDIILRATEAGVPVISAMGCGNRFDPSKLTVTDIYKTENDRLAKAVRRELRKQGVSSLPVVYSTEPAYRPHYEEVYGSGENKLEEEYAGKRLPPGSTPFVPNAAGILLASVVARELSGFSRD
ncbi:MAG: tRNA threonylcarbamoyladenosine dehydratase [Eubacteriales bacterium]|nr:tRNA threonylcarbamoyladenosine dehydratase [Eubacteriales bacterium]